MGFDIYFYKFSPVRDDTLRYQDWFGDVYTEYTSEERDDWETYKYIHPEHADIDDYELVSISGLNGLTFARKLKDGRRSKTDKFSIDCEDVPTKRVTVREAPVKRVGHFRMGYGGYMLGEKGEIDIEKMWKNLSDFVLNGDDYKEPVLSKERFIEMLRRPEFKQLAQQIKDQKINVNNHDYEVVYLSW